METLLAELATDGTNMWYSTFGFGVSLIQTIVFLAIRIIVAMILFASAKNNGSKAAFLWGLLGFSFPILTIFVYWLEYRKSKNTFCVVNEPCFKNTYPRLYKRR